VDPEVEFGSGFGSRGNEMNGKMYLIILNNFLKLKGKKCYKITIVYLTFYLDFENISKCSILDPDPVRIGSGFNDCIQIELKCWIRIHNPDLFIIKLH
jgi:hypothetical protein